MIKKLKERNQETVYFLLLNNQFLIELPLYSSVYPHSRMILILSMFGIFFHKRVVLISSFISWLLTDQTNELPMYTNKSNKQFVHSSCSCCFCCNIDVVAVVIIVVFTLLSLLMWCCCHCCYCCCGNVVDCRCAVYAVVVVGVNNLFL